MRLYVWPFRTRKPVNRPLAVPLVASLIVVVAWFAYGVEQGLASAASVAFGWLCYCLVAIVRHYRRGGAR